MVLLIGNYVPDQQQSMLRFNTMMLQGLTAAGIDAELIRPEPLFGNFRAAGAFVTKWLAYIDKYLIFPLKLKRRLAAGPSVVHICDHSNAVYAGRAKAAPLVVTCHDLLAVRGAFGDDTDCPASATGKLLQRWILGGLQRADAVACISRATMVDAQRLFRPESAAPKLSIVSLGLHYPYRPLPAGEAAARITALSTRLDLEKPFVLHVGSNLKRKNREGVLRIFARGKERWNGQLVFAGDALTPELHSLGRELDISDRVFEIVHPENESLEALYNFATALLYPSRFEGFGWPIAEAHACGCPVICSDRGPLPDAAGEAGLIHSVEDEEAFAADILRLNDPGERARWSEKSLRNAERFSAEKMIAAYVGLYRSVAPSL